MIAAPVPWDTFAPCWLMLCWSLLLCVCQNEITFPSFKKFKSDYYIFYVAMCRRLAKVCSVCVAVTS